LVLCSYSYGSWVTIDIKATQFHLILEITYCLILLTCRLTLIQTVILMKNLLKSRLWYQIIVPSYSIAHGFCSLDNIVLLFLLGFY
jgi:hypothetical protein